ncbi:hypothetical protein O3G_MSEX006829 [Manduca sexta]|uniref:Inositol polyphosphate 1-phosphatase n=1 Tax=Manduca sexta TaxID=7130 RepID=A0A921Z649_MANSE|nr:hypothetical protein O3G_MSEX006829 [Manduca sexta]KAG6450902.1 hypothetical protein O3G_MSEX006829 [Manduca sexta]
MADILKTFVRASERAACIARSCCVPESSKEILLVAEKFEGEANTRFEHDFKTIADVLAQESAKTEIAHHFPELANHVRGEECSEIGGINVSIMQDAEETANLLSLLVTPNAAKRMAEAAHCELQLDVCDKINVNISEINVSDIGIWIDPIDATAEFIAGVRHTANADQGLPCVTILIGAYLKSTGEPIMGVINQPFWNGGKGRIVWGISYNGIHKWGGDAMETTADNKIVLMSSAEKSEIIGKVKSSGFVSQSVPGAGHKLLKVVLGEAVAYLVTKGTTFKWDTCAAHAILRAKGGDIVTNDTFTPITYNDPIDADNQVYCNAGGIIAYSDTSVFDKLKEILS